jgi:hypothetical protein
VVFMVGELWPQYQEFALSGLVLWEENMPGFMRNLRNKG